MARTFFAVWLLLLFASCMPEYLKLNNSGYEKALAKEYEDAFKDFDSSIRKYDRYWLAYSNRGGCYFIQGKYEKAMEDFNTSISLHKKNEFAFDGRALCKEELNDYIGAISDFRQAIKYNKRFYIAYTHLGVLLSDIDSCKQALYYLKIGLEKKAFNDCTSEQEVIHLINKCQQKK